MDGTFSRMSAAARANTYESPGVFHSALCFSSLSLSLSLARWSFTGGVHGSSPLGRHRRRRRGPVTNHRPGKKKEFRFLFVFFHFFTETRAPGRSLRRRNRFDWPSAWSFLLAQRVARHHLWLQCGEIAFGSVDKSRLRSDDVRPCR